MSAAQRRILARMAWSRIADPGRPGFAWEADELGATPATLAVLVRRGWIESYKQRPDLPRKYVLLSEGFYALVGA